LIYAIRSRGLRNFTNLFASGCYILLIVVGWNHWIGLTLLIDNTEPEYLAVADYARQNTPIDALFLVPPNESEFRLRAQRAIIVNFKAVPQLGSELAEWSQRLRDVLGLDDLQKQLPNGFDKVGPAMGRLYDNRSADDLFAVARKYDARYVVATHHLDAQYDGKLIPIPNADDKYFLYDLQR
jgi:hypothetical protein